MEIPSALSVFKNFNLAGIDLNRFLISISVPSRYCEGLTSFTPPLVLEISNASSAVVNFDFIFNSDTDPMEASASPLKPRLLILAKSLIVLILEVACLDKASNKSSLFIP